MSFAPLDPALDPNKQKKPEALPPMGGGPDLSALGGPIKAPGDMGPPKPPALDSTMPPAQPPTLDSMNPGGTPPPQAPTTPPVGDPNAALGQVQNAFQAKFKRAMTPEEQQAIIKYAGYTGGQVDPAMLEKALAGVGQYSGDLANPWGAAAAGGGTGTTTPVDPAIGTGGLAQSELQKLLLTGGTDGMQLDMNNPAIQAQRTNFDRVNSRATGQQRLAAAERAAASGSLGSGGYDANLNAAEQSAGDRASGFEAQLMTQELQGQRERVMQGLQMALASNDTAQARALQERLGTLDATLRREGMSIQDKLGKGQLGLGLLNAMLGDKANMGNLDLGWFTAGNNANLGLLNSILNGAR